MTTVGAPHNAADLRQDAAIWHQNGAKIADDFAAKSADNAPKFANPARDRRGFPFQDHREDHL
jgi:hypothetical protein